MRLPPVIRYLPARLAPLANPFVWMPICALGITGIFIWEYRNHPEWLQWSAPDYESNNNLGLTPDEQGALAELDNLSVLLNETQSSSPATSQEPPQPNSPEPATAPEEQDETNTADLLAGYFEQYGLNRGLERAQPSPSPSATNALRNSEASSTALIPSSSDSLIGAYQGLGLTPTTASESPLAAAIRQRAATPVQSAAENRPERQLTPESVNSAGVGSEPDPTPLGNTAIPGQEELVQGGLPGVAGLSFIRTTPNMSPPPGTTGYTPPASLGLSTFERSFNQPNVPTAATSTITPSFELRRPQRPDNVLPGADTYQSPAQSPVPSTFGETTTPTTNTPPNTWDAFWGGY